MQPEDSRDDRTSLNASIIECRKVLLEYHYLAKLPRLTEEQATKLWNILKLAEQSSIVSFLLNEIDEKTFQELGFYDDTSHIRYQNEASIAQEHILTENERRILMGFSAVRQQEHKTSQTRTHPLKMQMVFDPTQSFRESLDKKMLLEYPPEEARYTGFFTSKSVPAKTDVRMSQTMRIFLNFIVEESVSWLSIAALISMFLLLLLI